MSSRNLLFQIFSEPLATFFDAVWDDCPTLGMLCMVPTVLRIKEGYREAVLPEQYPRGVTLALALYSEVHRELSLLRHCSPSRPSSLSSIYCSFILDERL